MDRGVLLYSSNRHFSDYLPRTTYSGSFVFETVLPSEIELEEKPLVPRVTLVLFASLNAHVILFRSLLRT